MIKSQTLSLKKHFIILIFSLLLGGLLAVYLGKDISWDIAAYHYYNPYAFLHKRIHIDYWPPAIIQAYFNPTLDFLTYFLINTFHPAFSEFILGALHGLNFWLIFTISYLLLVRYEKPQAFYLAFLFAVVGMYGPISLPEMGSFLGDNFISLFVLASVLLQILCLQHFSRSQQISRRLLFFSGWLLGLGIGFKLTAALYLIGASIALFCLPLPIRVRAKFLLIWLSATAIGILCVSGYWMVFLWQEYHNPFYPLLNGIFHAPNFPTYNWTDTRHLPTSLKQTLFFPFYFSWNGQTTDLQPFVDYRFPIVYLLFIASIIVWFYNKTLHRYHRAYDLTTYWLLLFFCFSYCAWLLNFSIMRYFVSAQILCPLIIYLLLQYLISNTSLRMIFLYSLLLFITVTMTASRPERTAHFGSDYFNVKLPVAALNTPNALVLIAFPSIFSLPPNPYPFPQNYLIPFFPPAWQFVGVPFSITEPHPLNEKINQQVANYHGQVYLLASHETLPGLYKIAKELGLEKSGDCHLITSDMERHGALLCPVTSIRRLS